MPSPAAFPRCQVFLLPVLALLLAEAAPILRFAAVGKPSLECLLMEAWTRQIQIRIHLPIPSTCSTNADEHQIRHYYHRSRCRPSQIGVWIPLYGKVPKPILECL